MMSMMTAQPAGLDEDLDTADRLILTLEGRVLELEREVEVERSERLKLAGLLDVLRLRYGHVTETVDTGHVPHHRARPGDDEPHADPARPLA